MGVVDIIHCLWRSIETFFEFDGFSRALVEEVVGYIVFSAITDDTLMQLGQGRNLDIMYLY